MDNKRDSYDLHLFHNFQVYFPRIADQVVCWYKDGIDTLFVRLDNGRALQFDDSNQAIRYLPEDPVNLSEEECRSEFGKRLQKVMVFRGVTQEELSSRTGIHRTLISQYMNGKHTPSFYVVDKIAKALNCSIDELRYR